MKKLFVIFTLVLPLGLLASPGEHSDGTFHFSQFHIDSKAKIMVFQSPGQESGKRIVIKCPKIGDRTRITVYEGEKKIVSPIILSKAACNAQLSFLKTKILMDTIADTPQCSGHSANVKFCGSPKGLDPYSVTLDSEGHNFISFNHSNANKYHPKELFMDRIKADTNAIKDRLDDIGPICMPGIISNREGCRGGVSTE